jgi:protoheme IX farnesyltransferase
MSTIHQMETISSEIENVDGMGLRERLACYAELTKPRIAFLLVLTAAAGFYMAPSAGPANIAIFVHSMIGISLLAFGVAALNQFIERETDALMKRTATRPLPTGKISARSAFIFGLILCLASEFYLAYFVNVLTAVFGLVVIVGYVLMYTPLKLRTTASTAIGAVPGAMPPLMGWTSANDNFSDLVGAGILFLILFLWQFPHFLAIATMYRDEYAQAGIKMLPAVEPDGRITARQIMLFTILLIPISLAPVFFGMAGLIYAAAAVLLGIWFLIASYKAAKSKTKESARTLLLVSVLYLPLLFLVMVIDKTP